MKADVETVSAGVVVLNAYGGSIILGKITADIIMRIVIIGLMKTRCINDLLLEAFREQRAQLRIYILRTVVKILHPKCFYFSRDGRSILKRIFAGRVGEERNREK